MGRGLAGLAFSGLMLMISVVNRGVASGSGDGLRYGANVVHLLSHYFTLLFRQATTRGSHGLLEMLSIAGLVVFAVDVIRGIWERACKEGRE